MEETITVSGAAPIVDTQSVIARKVVTKDVMDARPTGKNWNGIGQLTVGVVSNQVDVGGSSGEQQNQVSIHGGSYTDNIRTLDGMMLSNFACAYSCTGLSANDSSTQELSFDIGALSAEVAGGGIRINIVPRDGGDQFTGSAFGSIATKRLQSSNLTDGLRAKGITSVDSINKLWDSSFGVGGPLRQETRRRRRGCNRRASPARRASSSVASSSSERSSTFSEPPALGGPRPASVHSKALKRAS